jgi:subtilisin family serine protease
MRRTLLLLSLVCATLGLAGTGAAAPGATDTYYGLQWSHDQINVPEAWATSTGKQQVIAIVDSGVDLTHPDLKAKLVRGATFTGCPDDPNGCGNGDWESGLAAEAPSPHGTHVAGIAAASTNNGIGVAGVARDAKLMPVKVLTDEGGSFEEVAAGVRWAADHGADVINLSLCALPGVQALVLVGEIDDTKQAINYAVSRGVVVVAAAGNDSASICGEPGFNGNALCVVATGPDQERTWYSNFAVNQDLNVVAAPGGAGTLFCADDVISTVPAGTESVCGQNRPGYDMYAGTSMATPHVAGVAALLTAQGRDVFQVYGVLKSTARTPGVEERGLYTPTYGFGIVDAAAAVAAP